MKSSSDHFKKHPFEHTAIRTRPALVQQIFPRANSAQPLGWRLFPRRVDRDELGRAKPAVPWRTDGGERRVAALVARSPLMPANTHTYTKHRLCEHTHTQSTKQRILGASMPTQSTRAAAVLVAPLVISLQRHSCSLACADARSRVSLLDQPRSATAAVRGQARGIKLVASIHSDQLQKPEESCEVDHHAVVHLLLHEQFAHTHLPLDNVMKFVRPVAVGSRARTSMLRLRRRGFLPRPPHRR